MTTSTEICQAAAALRGFVGFNIKTGQMLLRFSEDSFGLDVPPGTIVPTDEFVWRLESDGLSRLDRARLSWLQGQRIDERLGFSQALHLYLRRADLPEITAQRQAIAT